jgi:hypothetical protein
VNGIAQTLEHAGGYAPEEAKRLAESMLPDVLPYDPIRSVAYPDNGRLFTDDVGDYLVAILTNGRVTEDKVGPHDDPAGVSLRRAAAREPDGGVEKPLHGKLFRIPSF